MSKEKLCGIYCIENILDHKKYIGATTDIYRRWKAHENKLDKGISENHLLQEAWNKDGKDNFYFKIIEICEEEILFEKEKDNISLYDSNNFENGYNLTSGGRGLNDHICTEEMRKQRSIAKKGKAFHTKPHSEETKKKMSLVKLGKKMSLETCLKISANSKGNKYNLGRKASNIARKHMSEARKGKSYYKGYIPNESTKEKIAIKSLGEKRRKNTTSKYVGVQYKENKKYWTARIGFKNKDIYIGSFLTEVEAALAYNEVAQEYYGWKARLNIIPQEEIDACWSLTL